MSTMLRCAFETFRILSMIYLNTKVWLFRERGTPGSDLACSARRGALLFHLQDRFAGTWTPRRPDGDAWEPSR